MTFLTPQADQNPIAAAQATSRLHRAIGADPSLSGAVVTNLLRLVPNRRAIWAGQLADRHVILRLALCAEEENLFEQEWQELRRAHAGMAKGANRVVAPIAFRLDSHLMVMERAEGVPLLDHLWSIEADQRLNWFPKAAAWLSDFTVPTTEWTKLNRGPWRNWAEAAAARQTHPASLAVETKVLRKMKALSRVLRAHDTWRSAIGHGDFHPNNLIAGPDCLTGIDLGGSNRSPIYKDMARFLTHMARRGMVPSGQRRFGVDAIAFDAFVQRFDLADAEAQLFLPYLICFETLIRVEHPNMPAARVAHGVAMAEALLEDLRQIV